MTHACFNFAPDVFEQERIKKAARGDWDAGIDLCMRDILYDEKRGAWVRGPEPDFDHRRTWHCRDDQPKTCMHCAQALL